MAVLVLIAIALVLPSILTSLGYAVPIWAFGFTILAAVAITGFFVSEAYVDGRARGLGRVRSALAGIGGLFSGWWSTGV